MTIWFHTTILATCLAATIAVGLASAAKIDAAPTVAPKGDLLPVAAPSPEAAEFVTVEARGDGMSVLARVPAEIFVD